MSAKKVLALLVGALFIVIGVWVVLANQRSEDQITAEAAAAHTGAYHPVCDGKEMEPGDTCLRFGGGQSSQTYGEMMNEYYAEHTTDKIRSRYRSRQGIGVGVGVVGLLIIVPTIALAVMSRKKVQPAPQVGYPGAYPTGPGSYPTNPGPYPTSQGPYPSNQGPYPSA